MRQQGLPGGVMRHAGSHGLEKLAPRKHWAKGGTCAVSQTLSIGVPSRGIQGLARSWPQSVGHVLTSPLLRSGPSQSWGGPLLSLAKP